MSCGLPMSPFWHIVFGITGLITAGIALNCHFNHRGRR